MKKILIGLFFILFSITVQAEEKAVYWLNLNGINIKPDKCEWSGWKFCDLDACVDLENGVLWIYSPTLQVFDLLKINEKNRQQKDATQFSVLAKDRNNHICEIVIWTDPDGKSYLLIRYADGEYKYSIK